MREWKDYGGEGLIWDISNNAEPEFNGKRLSK